MKKFFDKGLPYLKTQDWPGTLIVIEGADCSGRTTQIALLRAWLEAKGHAVLDTEFKRSNLVKEALDEAMDGNTLGKTTLSLLYATDFADQLENKIIPALSAGYVVLADRYIFTLMARDLVRGADQEWLRKLFGFALVPDLVFYLQSTPEELLYRAFKRYGQLDYWESGMDLGLSGDIFESFHKYQMMLHDELEEMARLYEFVTINGSDSVESIHRFLRCEVQQFLDHRKAG